MPAKAIWGIVIALLVGCEERQRLTFESDPEDRLGPSTQIDPPSRDTTLTEGDPFVVGARSVDTSGVDSIFIDVDGAGLSYPPIEAHGADTVSFAINLPTLGLSGRTVRVTMYGVDVIGNIGLTVTRQLTIE